MNEKLLQSFLQTEASPFVRQLLLRHIAECRAGATTGRRTFDFNEFTVTIDSDLRSVLVENELNTDANGSATWSLDEFAAALWRAEVP